MILKPGVRLQGIRPEVVVALIAAQEIWKSLGVELVVTSCIDGTHSRGSMHYSGSAVDLRSANLGTNAVSATQRLQTALGNDYDVLLETDHIHVEYQPKDPL